MCMAMLWRVWWWGLLECVDECDEGVAVVFGVLCEEFAGGLCFAAVPEVGFFDAARASVVEEALVLVDVGEEADAPEGRGFPLGGLCVEGGAVVRESGSHVV